MIWDTIKLYNETHTDPIKSPHEYIKQSGYLKCTNGGCVECNFHMCQDHFDKFVDHNDVIQYKDVTFPKEKKE